MMWARGDPMPGGAALVAFMSSQLAQLPRWQHVSMTTAKGSETHRSDLTK